MIEIKKQSLLETLSLYFEKRMARILLLGIIQGFPFVLIYTALTLWLRDNEFSRSQVGFISLIGVTYGFNWLWAPLVDRIRIPWLTNKIGHRRSWIVIMQLIILISLVLWGLNNPKENIWIVGLVGLTIAIASATQDIVTDALRIEQVGKTEGASMSAGAGVMVIGWFTGYKIGGMITLFIAHYLEELGIQNFWQITFLLLTIIIIACNIALMFVPEEHSTERQIEQKKTELKKLQEMYSEPEKLPEEIKITVAKRIENTKSDLKKLYSDPKGSIMSAKTQKWVVMQVVKVFLGIPIIPGK